LVLNYGGYNGTTVTTAAAGTDYNIRTKASYSGTVLDANGIPVARQDTSGGIYGSITLAHDGASTLNGAGLTINGQTYTLIQSMSELATATDAGKKYALGQNLDACGKVNANCGAVTTYTAAVRAILDGTVAGLGHTVTNLTINTTTGTIGLFGSATAGSIIRDIGLVDAHVTGGANTGALAGSNSGAISNAYVTGTGTGGSGSTVVGASNVGGLVGNNVNALGSSIRSSFSNADVAGRAAVGGLVGQNTGAGSLSASANTSVTPNVFNFTPTYTSGLIDSSHATGKVTNVEVTTTMQNYGGLVGANTSGKVSNSYASGDVFLTNANGKAVTMVGGLIGQNAIYATVMNSFADGNVTSPGGLTSTSNVGGLAGSNEGS
jgi:hypothetical protein